MDNFYIATIMLFGAPWEPRGWKICNGQLLPIAQYQALFSVIGATYGGDGRTTFALPDLRGRAPIGIGQGPGLNPIDAGQVGGAETTTLTEAEMPVHSHQATLQNGTVAVSSEGGNATSPEGNVPAVSNMVTRGDDVTGNIYTGDANTAMKSGSVSGDVAVGNSGGGRPFDNRSPWLGMNYIMCIEGLYPSRN